MNKTNKLYCTIEEHRKLKKAGFGSCPKCGGSTSDWLTKEFQTKYFYTLPDFPKRVVVELTNTCNLNCDYCPRHHLDMEPGFMSPKLFKSIIDQCSEHSCDVIPFWRGEMFLHEDVHELLTYAVYSVPNVYVATNGSRWRTSAIPQNTFNKLKSISVSLHNAASVGTLCNLNEQREFELPHLQASAVEQTPSEVIINTLSLDFLRSTDTKRIYKYHTRNGKWGQTDNHVDEPDRPGICSRLLTDFIIAWDGSISRCCYVWPTMKYLNVNILSIKQIWTQSSLQFVRDNYPDPICLACDQWKGGGRTL